MAGSKQLISQFNPDSYDLSLELDKLKKTFTGRLQILGSRCSKPSYRITLNQNSLRVTDAKLFKIEKGIKSELKISRIVHHNKLHELRIHTDTKLTSGKYRIDLKYSGRVAEKGTSGIYLSKWTDENGTTKEIITTQFQPHYARQLLPCIDEPQAKATFNLTLSLTNLVDTAIALFNTNIDSEKEIGQSRILKFQPTPRMSTYLLALIVGDIKAKTAKSKNGTDVCVYTTPDKIEQTGFALELSVKVLELLEDKFKTNYPLEKLDLVAVPDFDAGGMENWGLITFREDLLLFDEDTSTLMDKQAIALVVAHEIAHQWFGNLVTMKWWDELWLNEGFANFMEYYIVDSIFPEWKMFEGYLVNEKSYAVRVDSLPSSRPIIKKVTTCHHAVEAFDGIAYEKSGSIIRMIFGMIGEENFMIGLNDYFSKYAYKSATSSDLVACWQKLTKLNLNEFVSCWLNEPGLPKVEVSLGANNKQIILEQSRFLSQKPTKLNLKTIHNKTLREKPNIKTKQRVFYKNLIKNEYSKNVSPFWHIPINFVSPETSNLPTKQATASGFVMTKQRHIVQLSKDGQLPIKLNRDGSSFYLASYSTDFLAGISLALSNNNLQDLDTLNVLTDIISLNRAGQFRPGAAAILEIIKSAKATPNPHFWGLAGSFIGYLHYHLKQIGKTRILDSYISSLTDEALGHTGFNNSPDDDSGTTITRFELLSMAVLARDKSCCAKLVDLYEKSKDTGLGSIEAEKRLLTLYVVAKRGRKSDYDYLLQHYKNNLSDPGLRDDITYALCLFENDELILKNLRIMQDPDLVRSQDIISWFSQIISVNQKGTELVLEWTTKQNGWSWLNNNLSPYDLSSAVKVLLSTAFSTKDLNQLNKFFEKVNNIELEKALKESQDIAKSRISWHKKELPKVIEYLS